jgi:hypothetical protein
VLIVGHNLSEQRARETMEFDIWRVRDASPQRAKEVLGEEAFRIGQLLAEGAWSGQEVTSGLLKASEYDGLRGKLGKQGIKDFINARIKEGNEAKGVFQHPIRRGEYTLNR